ncbi:MAG: S8 family serine peptidase, partial [Anaeromyxobacteraceae bacterium]
MLRHCIAGWLLFCVAFSVQAAPQDPFDGTRLIVKFRDSVHSSERARIEAEHRLTKHSRIPGIGAEVCVVDPRDTPSGIAKKLRDTRSRSIEYTEPDRVANVTFVPSDPQLSSQWHHTTIQSPRAWDTARGDGVTIGVIDTGVDFTHPELAGSVIQGWNFSDDSADVSDGSGHGTMVAGTAAAIGDNLAGVAGVAFRSRILAIRVPPTIEISVLANAIVYAADHGARVANLSYGPVCDSATIGDAARYIRARGGVLVVSAGNEGSESNAEDLPITCVSATDQSDALAPFSSFGS